MPRWHLLGAPAGVTRGRHIDMAAAALLIGGTAALFVFDVSAPRGAIDGVGYAAVVALCTRFSRRTVWGCAIITTFLTIIAHFFLSDSGISLGGELANRAFAIASIWIVAVILTSRMALEQDIKDREAKAKIYQEALQRIVRGCLPSIQPLDDCIRALTEIAGEALAADRTSIYRLHQDREVLRCTDLWERDAKRHSIAEDISVEDGRGFFESLQKHTVVTCDDVLNDPLRRARGENLLKRNIGALLLGSIVIDGRLQGLVSFAQVGKTRHWTSQDAGFAQSLASIVTLMFLARERANLESKLLQAAKMQALGQLAGGVAHDFSNILGAIAGFASLLSQDVTAGSPQHSFAQRILDASDRGRELVQQILAFARIQGSERRIIGLHKALIDSESLLSGSLPKSTRLIFNELKDDLRVYGRDIQVAQLIVNLCHNASDALMGAPGTVTVNLDRATPSEIDALRRVEADDETMIGKLDPTRAYARIRVSDTGGGIAPDILGRIFEPFFTTKGRRRGTGLGLAVVHGVVEAHDGACHVASRANMGTIFSVYLPLALEEHLETRAQTSQADGLAGDERLLIVDDDQDIADMLCIGFDRLGYVTAGVNDPVQALAAFEEDPTAWDAVIADQLMPSMRGLELIRRMKTIHPGIVAVVCTGYSDGASEEDSREAGVDAFFRKPVDARQITPRLRSLLDSRRT